MPRELEFSYQPGESGELSRDAEPVECSARTSTDHQNPQELSRFFQGAFSGTCYRGSLQLHRNLFS